MATISSPKINAGRVKGTFWTAAAFYALIAFEFFYMASPFAIYFYSVYGPALNFVNQIPLIAWLSSVFLPHIVIETSAPLLDQHNLIGAILAVLGFTGFCIGAGQVYYHKLARKGAVTGGIYNFIRHPQYASLNICSFGLLLLWPRFMVLISFVTMLFAYYFLARLEEKECEQKFGNSYLDYAKKTGMFLPFPTSWTLPFPQQGLPRYAAILGLYAATLALSIGIGLGIRAWALNSLYALYTPEAAYVSVSRLESSTLQQIMQIALADPEVQQKLGPTGTRYINYVLPATWYVSEVPMAPLNAEGHYYPHNYGARYRIVFTEALIRAGGNVNGQDILLNVQQRRPLMEVVVDLDQNQVLSIQEASTSIRYENIPVPVY